MLGIHVIEVSNMEFQTIVNRIQYHRVQNKTILTLTTGTDSSIVRERVIIMNDEARRVFFFLFLFLFLYEVFRDIVGVRAGPRVLDVDDRPVSPPVFVPGITPAVVTVPGPIL